MKLRKNIPLPVSLLLGLLFMLVPVHAKNTTTASAESNYDKVRGEWQRTDGNYSLKVSAVLTDGAVQVDYFNPRPIHIAEASVSTQENLIKLFIKFQDEGYEGSTYSLYYYAEKDALAGFYYHAVLDRTYKVIFFRKPIDTTGEKR